MILDCVVIGGGSGGLAAALVLGRASKRVHAAGYLASRMQGAIFAASAGAHAAAMINLALQMELATAGVHGSP